MSTSPLPPPGITLQLVPACPPKDRDALAKRVARLEKKMFAASEAFDYGVELGKKSVGLVLAERNNGGDLVGYLVYQRLKGQTWLHKLAVVEAERGKGVATCLVGALRQQVGRGGGRNVVLWVDEGNAPARALYASCGFEQVERLADYYGPGRTALKMELDILK